MSRTKHTNHTNHSPPDKRHLRIASFNMQRTRCCKEIVTLTTNLDADFITFQEPPHAAVTPLPNTNTSSHTSFVTELTTHCNSVHYIPYITNNTIVLIKSSLHVNLKQHPTPLHAGRAQFFLFKLRRDEFLVLISLYNYQTGYKNTDDVHSLKNSIHKQLATYRSHYTNLHVIVAGDINISTVTQKYSPTTGNLLRYFVEQQKLTSVLPTLLNTSTTTICTRFEAARGYSTSPDHILCSPSLLSTTYNPVIDTDCCFTTIPSDHFLIACDFELASGPDNSPPATSHNKPTYAYSKICSIPLTTTDEWEEPSHIPPLTPNDRFTHSTDITSNHWFIPTQHRLTSSTYTNNINMYNSLLQKHREHPVVKDMFLQLVHTLNQLELSVKHSHEQLHSQQSSSSQSQDAIPPLIPRTKQQKRLINQAMTLFIDGLNFLLETAGFSHHPSKKRSLPTAQRPSKKRRRQPATPVPIASTPPSSNTPPTVPPFEDLSSTVTFPAVKEHLLQQLNHCLTLTTRLLNALAPTAPSEPINRCTRHSRSPTLTTLLPKIDTLITSIITTSTNYTTLHTDTITELAITATAASTKQQPTLLPRSYKPTESNLKSTDAADHIPKFVHDHLSTLTPNYNVPRASFGISTTCAKLQQLWAPFSPSSTQHSSTAIPTTTTATALKSHLTTLKGHVFQLHSHLQTAYTDHNTTLNLLGRATAHTLPKHKDTPAPELFLKTHHTPGLPPTLTPALTLNEQLHATKHNHSEHMANPPGTNCFFATPATDAAGLCGIKTHFNKTFKLRNINTFFNLPKNSKLDKHLTDFVIHAHDIIKPMLMPKPAHSALAWPFIYKLNEDDPYIYSFNDFAESLRPSPDASRHGNFHLNILTRLHRDWAIQAHRLINLCLICRILPIDGKCMSRVPIPKPGTTDRRPISLQHSFEAHLSNLVATHLTNGIETIGALPPHIYAYRKSKSCTDITLSHVAVLEDLKQYLHPHLAQLDEDFEKYFDRITHEIQCLALMRHHCPTTGYVEFISDCFQDNRVDIITNLGTVLSTFPCGVKQGSALSCIIANLVAHMYTEVWTTPIPTSPNTNFAYQFHSPFNSTSSSSTSTSSPIPHIVTSYCDDGSRYLSATSMPQLIDAIQHYTNAVGAFSIVTRIGRNATKSTVRLYNTPVGYTPPPIHSIAWSFAHRFIHEANLTVVHLPFLLPSVPLPSSTPELPAPHRSLGTYVGLDGDITNNSTRLYRKLHQRLYALRDLPTHPLTDSTLKHSLLASVATFNPLCVRLTPEQTIDIDTRIRTLASHKYDIPAKSLHYVLHLSHKTKFGYNQPSIYCTQLKGLIRELVVLLNTPPSFAPTPTSTHLLARLHSSVHDIHHEHDNFIRDAMTTLAHQGFFLRPLTDLLLTSILDHHTLNLPYLGSITTSSNHDPKLFDHLPDVTASSLEQTLYTYSYSRLFTAILDYLRSPSFAFRGGVNPDELNNIYDSVPLTIPRPPLNILLTIINDTLNTLRGDLNTQLSFYTWSPPLDAITPSTVLSSFRNSDHWTLLSPFQYLTTNPYSRRCLDYDPNANIRDFFSYTTDDAQTSHAPSYCVNRPTPSIQSFPDFFTTACHSTSPLIFASDGGCKPNISLYAASTVVTTVPTTDSLASALTQPSVPLFARAQFLPSTIGTHNTSINTTEATALLHSLQLHPNQYPSLFLIDNLPLFTLCQRLLAPTAPTPTTAPTNPRILIRDLYPSIGLPTALLLHQYLHRIHTETIPASSSHPYSTQYQLLLQLVSYLPDNHLLCLNSTTGAYLAYIPSHQLTRGGTISSASRSSTTPLPTEYLQSNFLLFHANSLADAICTNMLGSKTSSSCPPPHTDQQCVSHPFIPSLLFSFSYNNTIITTSHTDTVHDAHQCHLLTRLSTHPSHGWISRHLPDLFDPLGLIHINSPAHRILLHLASSHTEWLKYNTTYKTLHFRDIQSTLTDHTTSAAIAHAQRICPFCSSSPTNPSNTAHTIYPQPLQPEGTNLHLHTQCTNPILCECRNFFADKLNLHLSSLYTLTSCIHNLVSPDSPHFDTHLPFHNLIGHLLRTWDAHTTPTSTTASAPNPSSLHLHSHLQPFLTAHETFVPSHSPRQHIMPTSTSPFTTPLPSHPSSTAYLARDAALLPTPPLTALPVSRKHHSILDLSYTGLLPKPLHTAVNAHITHHLTLLRTCLTSTPDPPHPSQNSQSPSSSLPLPPSAPPSAPPPPSKLTSQHLIDATLTHRQFDLASDAYYTNAISVPSSTPSDTPTLLQIFHYHWTSIQSILVQRANCLQHVIFNLLHNRLRSLRSLYISSSEPISLSTPSSPLSSPPPSSSSHRQLTIAATATSPTASTTTAPLTMSLSTLSPRRPTRLSCKHPRCQLAHLVNEPPNTHLPSYSSCHACSKHDKLIGCTTYLEQSLLTYPTIRHTLADLLQPLLQHHHAHNPSPLTSLPDDSAADLLYQTLNQYCSQTLAPLSNTFQLTNIVTPPSCSLNRQITLTIAINLLLNTFLLPPLNTYAYDPISPTTAHLLGTLHTIFQPCTCPSPSPPTTPPTPCRLCHHFRWPTEPPLTSSPDTTASCCTLCTAPSLFPATHTLVPPLCASCYLYCLLHLRPIRLRWNTHLYNTSITTANEPQTPLIPVPSLTESPTSLIPSMILLSAPPAKLTTRHLSPAVIRMYRNSITGTTPLTPTTFPLPDNLSTPRRLRYQRGLLLANLFDDSTLLQSLLLPIPPNFVLHHQQFLQTVLTKIFKRLQPLTPSLHLRLHQPSIPLEQPLPQLLPTIPTTTSALITTPMISSPIPPHIVLLHHSTGDDPPRLHTIVQPLNSSAHTLLQYDQQPQLFATHHPQLYHLLCQQHSLPPTLSQHPTLHTITLLPPLSATSLPTTPITYLLTTLYLYMTYPIQPPPPSWNTHILARSEHSLHTLLQNLLLYLITTATTPQLWIISPNQ